MTSRGLSSQASLIISLALLWVWKVKLRYYACWRVTDQGICWSTALLWML